jgi:DNA-3-methyladenine glycosylase II
MPTPEILQHLKQDVKLAFAIQNSNPTIKEGNGKVYEALLEAIVSQQLSVKAADTIYQRFLKLYIQHPEPSELIQTPFETLRSVGLSNQKAKYIQNVGAFFEKQPSDPLYWQKIEDEQIIKELTQIKGVGVWTVQMILMFTLNRLDIMPVLDLGIKQAMIRLYELNESGKELEKKMLDISMQWKPYRTIACRYLWSWKDKK